MSTQNSKRLNLEKFSSYTEEEKINILETVGQYNKTLENGGRVYQLFDYLVITVGDKDDIIFNYCLNPYNLPFDLLENCMENSIYHTS